ncbi:MAG: aminoacyl-tRNA hydrolase [Actinobacteria bacterium]|nr:aminoacyl-tRNA hydrolase [Actinomycetota bacterium]
MILIVGLGNPGSKYYGSRHNIGFAILDVLCDSVGNSRGFHLRFNSELRKINYLGSDILLLKPLTYMNNSGSSVAAVDRLYSSEIENILVLHDDIDINFGQIRFKRGGGSGGHNGVDSIIKSLKTTSFDRLRFGVGRPPDDCDASDFVLRKFKKAELQQLDNLLSTAVDAVKDYIEYGIDFAMNRYNNSND